MQNPTDNTTDLYRFAAADIRALMDGAGLDDTDRSELAALANSIERLGTTERAKRLGVEPLVDLIDCLSKLYGPAIVGQPIEGAERHAAQVPQ